MIDINKKYTTRDGKTEITVLWANAKGVVYLLPTHDGPHQYYTYVEDFLGRFIPAKIKKRVWVNVYKGIFYAYSSTQGE
jgi:hypothetical protein